MLNFKSHSKLLISGTFLLALLIIGGFIAGYFISGTASCNLKGCPCSGIEDLDPSEQDITEINETASEIPCNSCSSHDPVFYTSVVNIVESCSGTEKLTCKDGKQVDRIVEYDDCSYELSLFGIPL